MRGAMQLLFSFLDFKMTNTVKMLKTRPSTVITMPPKEATRADVSLKDEVKVILAIQFQDQIFPSDKLIRFWTIGNFLGNPWRYQIHVSNISRVKLPLQENDKVFTWGEGKCYIYRFFVVVAISLFLFIIDWNDNMAYSRIFQFWISVPTSSHQPQHIYTARFDPCRQ